MLSPLQIRRHWLGEVQLKPADNPIEEALRLRSISCRGVLAARFREDDTRRWLLKLSVELLPGEESAPSLYTGFIEMLGDFQVHADYPEEKRADLVKVGGGGILYSCIREWVSLVTARSVHGPVELPTLDPRSFLGDGEEGGKK